MAEILLITSLANAQLFFLLYFQLKHYPGTVLDILNEAHAFIRYQPSQLAFYIQ